METESTFFFFFNLMLDWLFVLISHTFKNKSSFEKKNVYNWIIELNMS